MIWQKNDNKTWLNRRSSSASNFTKCRPKNYLPWRTMSKKGFTSKFRNYKTKKTKPNNKRKDNWNSLKSNISNHSKIRSRKRTTWKNCNRRKIRSLRKPGNPSYPKFKARKRMTRILGSKWSRKIRKICSNKCKKNKKSESQRWGSNLKKLKRSNLISKMRTSSSSHTRKSA